MANNENKDLQERIKLLREQAALLKDIARLEEEVANNQKKQVDLQNQINSVQTEVQNTTVQQTSVQDDLLAKQKEITDENKKFIRVIKQQIDIRTNISNALTDQEETIKKIAEEETIRNNLSQEGLDTLKMTRQNLEKVLKQESDRIDNSTQNSKNFITIYKYLSLTADVEKKMMPQLEKDNKNISSIGKEVKKYPEHFNKSQLSAKKLFQIFAVGSLVSRVISIGKELDSLLASFNQTTGAGGKFNDVIDASRLGMNRFGVGLKEAGKSAEDLFMGYNDFVFLSQTSQKELVQTNAVLARVGVSSQLSAKLMNTLTKSLKQNVDQAIQTQKGLALFATQAGLAPQQVAQDFDQALPRLTAYGSRAIDIFKKLETQSKATGLSMEDLLSITEQFDTFEGAAEAAGKLNAVLGGGMLNSVELLNASEEERVMLLRNAVKESGRDFASLSKFEQKAIAATVGIKDMNQAVKLFGTSDEEFQRVQGAINDSANATATLQKHAQSATSAQEKFNLIFQAFSGAALPVLNVINSVLNAVLSFTDAIGASWAVPAVVGFTVALLALGKAVTFINSVLTALTGKTIGQTFATQADTIAKGQNAVATTTSSTTIGINTVAVETNAVAQETSTVATEGGIIAKTASKVAFGLETIASWAATAALTAYEVVTWLATAASTALGVAMIILTSPITLIVLGVAALVAGIIGLVYYFDEITEFVQTATNGFFDFYDIILLLGGPVTWFILAGKKIYENWDMVVSGITELFSGLVSFVQSAFQKIADFIKVPINGNIDLINAAISKINILPGMSIPVIPHLAKGIDNFGGGMAVVGENGPELVSIPQGSSVITNDKAEMLAKASQNKTKAITQQQNAFAKTSNQPTNTNQGFSIPPGTPLIIKIDERELGRIILNVLNGEMRANLVGS